MMPLTQDDWVDEDEWEDILSDDLNFSDVQSGSSSVRTPSLYQRDMQGAAAKYPHLNIRDVESEGEGAFEAAKGVAQGLRNIPNAAMKLFGGEDLPQLPPSFSADPLTPGSSEAATFGRMGAGMLMPGGPMVQGGLAGAAMTGEPIDAAKGAALGAALQLAPAVPSLVRNIKDSRLAGAATEMAKATPVVGTMGRAAVRGWQQAGKVGKNLETATAEAQAVLDAEKAAHAVNSGTKPGPAFPPPPGMGASTPPPVVNRPAAPTTSTPQVPPSNRTVPGKAAKAAGTSMEFKPSPTSGSATLKAPPGEPKTPPTPSKPTFTREEAIEKLKDAKTPQERGAAFRELRGKGASREDVGAALSDATNKPLDIDDLSEAKDFLKQAGSLDKALEIIRNHPENSVQDVIRLTRAVREASRAK